MLLVLLALILTACQGEEDLGPETTVLVLNPYESVDWDNDAIFLANLHTHTTHSDGQSMPHDVVDYYHALGYDILAITDHDLYTYPWTFSDIDPLWEDRDPSALGMLAIPGNEYTNWARSGAFHDIVGLFTDHLIDFETFEGLEHEAMTEIAERGGMMIMAHPGRYWKIFTSYETGERYSPEWYLDFFDSFNIESLLGIEIYSQQDRHNHDRDLWDRLLMDSMPERPIWGFGTDDYHGADPDGRINWSFTNHFMREKTVDDFKDNLITGAFYTSYTNQESDTAPTITRIIVNEDERYIEIIAEDYETIKWFSGVDETLKTSQLIQEGNRFYYGHFQGSYIRAEIWKDEYTPSVSLTQPFGFYQED